ncbi:MAG TPA: glycine betaine ABC transporter substrate-binding protein [Gemmatimonadaceae bacterium]|nr:glycine betaine ABC transporter substrate-binding protein [Gemmatimonadaceae bacterium]
MKRHLIAILALIAPATTPSESRPVIVGSKPFGESYILAEMFAQLLEARGFRVERRLGLGATLIAYPALAKGAIDVYPEYTGTGLLAILGDSTSSTDPKAVYARVSTELEKRDGVRWLAPLGFENTYAIAVRKATADSLHLTTISDLARVGSGLRGGLTADFIGRPDGLPKLGAVYGLHLAEVKALLPAVKYQALAQGAVDVIDGYETDGSIERYHVVVLTDDRHAFPPYEAVAVVSPMLQRDLPGAVLTLSELSDRIDVARMRAWNRQLEVERVPVATIAHQALGSLHLLSDSAMAIRPKAQRESEIDYGHLAALTGRHLELVAISMVAAIVFAIPLALLLTAAPKRAETVIRAVGVLQTIPGIALVAFMIPLFGIGVFPALVALWLYSLYPIVRNTYTGIRDADPGAADAAKALGMTGRQVLIYVRLPLAAPVIMAGIRTAAVIDVGTATLAAFIGAGGLGDPIVSGLALSDTRMILSGAIPAALLALAVDGVLAVTERVVTTGRGRARRSPSRSR